MSLPSDFERLVHAIALANGHSHPGDWVANVKAAWESLEPKEEPETPQVEPPASGPSPAPAVPAEQEG